MLRYLTAGESHGKCLVAILEGMVSGLKIDKKVIDNELSRRQQGYGRGGRMKIEKDKVDILSGLRKGVTIGSPISVLIENKDFGIDRLPAVVNPRPGHADLAGALKYNTKDVRDILERSSGRETAARVAVGAICKSLLDEFGIEVLSHVMMIGGIEAHARDLSISEIKKNIAKSPLRCADPDAEKLMIKRIDSMISKGDSAGGIFEVIATGVPAGLGSYAQYDRKLDANLAGGLMSIQAIKAVEIGQGIEGARVSGLRFHDAIYYKKGQGFYRKTNNAGGIEGGMSNGEPIVIRGFMKPIATLGAPLDSVNIKTKKALRAAVERRDVCAVPAAGVVGEAVVAFELAKQMLLKFGGDSLGETKRNFESYVKQVKNF